VLFHADTAPAHEGTAGRRRAEEPSLVQKPSGHTSPTYEGIIYLTKQDNPSARDLTNSPAQVRNFWTDLCRIEYFS